jgi:glycosyltransferase involved in cell wall biosynthesis
MITDAVILPRVDAPSADPPQTKPRLALVVPAKDEAERLPAALERIADWVRATRFPLELVVVDDGSTDGTGTAAAAYARRLPHLRVVRHAVPRGKGAALRTGFAAAVAPVVAFSDADLSAPIEQLPLLLAAVVEGADVAVGSRRVPGGPRPAGRGLVRALTSAVFARLAGWILPTGVRDTQCGFKAFRSGAAREIVRQAQVDGFAFDAEWLALARRMKLRIVEVPVRWAHDERSTVSVLRAARTMFADLWRVRRRLSAAPAESGS